MMLTSLSMSTGTSWSRCTRPLGIELFGSRGSVGFDLERINELRITDDATGGTRTLLVTEPDHPYLDAWWPPGHVIGWEHTFTHQAADLLRAVAEGRDPQPSFAEGLSVQRVLDAVEQSAAQDGRRVAVPAPSLSPVRPAAV